MQGKSGHESLRYKC